MSSLNKAQLIGNLGKDPEVRTLQNGSKVVTLRMATTEKWRDKQSGDTRERTEWHTVVIWNEGLAGVAEKYLSKGSKCYVEGQIQTRKWQDKDGQDRYSTEIVLQAYNGSLVLLGDREGGGGGNRRSDDRDDDRGGSRGGDDGGGRGDFGRNPGRTSNRRPANDLDDDIPF